MNKHLHIVCLEAPWPTDHGGAIDMMNRIMKLHELGIHIHLHYFNEKGEGTPNELNQFCESIRVYEREACKKGLSSMLPFTGAKANEEMIKNLSADNHPMLLEGIHCTGILTQLDLSSRKVVVRMHNEKNICHAGLGRADNSLLKKLRFFNDSKRTKNANAELPEQCTYACGSKNDGSTLRNIYHLDNVRLLPAFPTWQQVNGEEGQGNFCLYHGNLSVPENEKAALWLLCNVVTKARTPFIIAGKNPSRRLIKVAELCQHTCLVADPSETEMNDLVRKAHIHVLPCFDKEATGVRLKLLHALFEGRHCLVNEQMVAGTGLEEACHIGTTANAFASIIMQLYHQPFTREEKILRKQLLGNTYDNEKNTRELIQWLW